MTYILGSFSWYLWKSSRGAWSSRYRDWVSGWWTNTSRQRTKNYSSFRLFSGWCIVSSLLHRLPLFFRAIRESYLLVIVIARNRFFCLVLLAYWLYTHLFNRRDWLKPQQWQSLPSLQIITVCRFVIFEHSLIFSNIASFWVDFLKSVIRSNDWRKVLVQNWLGD